MEYDDKYEDETLPKWLREDKGERRTEDNINHSDHDGIETIDVIKAWCSDKGYQGFLEGSIIKCISRWKNKDGVQDLKKAQWYLSRLIKVVEHGS